MSSQLLHIAPGFTLPIEIGTQSMAVLAKRRAGKSYLCRKIVEELFRLQFQTVVLDPKGDWWGLRSSADGKGAGLPFIILGGEHGDVDLEVGSGEMVAKLAVEERVSMLIDLSLFRKREVSTFCTGFLENLYRLKAKEVYRTPMFLMADEADSIAPQKPQEGEERMLGAMEDIVRRGGQRGIGVGLATQRSAVLNKNVLTQSELMIALRTIAPQDLAAMQLWIDVHGTVEQKKILMESLPSLPIGDAWFWSPGWPTEEGIFERVHVDRIKTFDSGATPKPGEKKIVPKKLADIDIDVIKKQMADTVERTLANDPKLLRKRIAELENALKKEQNKRLPAMQSTPQVDPNIIQKAIQDALQQCQNSFDAELEALKGEVFKAIEREAVTLKNQAVLVVRSVRKSLKNYPIKVMPFKLQNESKGIPTNRLERPTSSLIKEMASQSDHLSQRNMVAAAGDADKSMSPGQKEIMAIVANYPDGITRRTISVLCSYAVSSRNTYLQQLSQKGYVETAGDNIFPTSEGVKVLGERYKPLPKGIGLIQYWLKELTGGEQAIFKHLVDNLDGLSREEICNRTNYARSSTNTYLQRLSARLLIGTKGENVILADELKGYLQ